MKKTIALFLALIMALSMLTGCAKTDSEQPKEPSGDAASSGDLTPSKPEQPAEEPVTVRLAGLKGPTTIGMVKLLDDAENKKTAQEYTFQMAAQIITPILSAILIDTLMKGSMRILFPYAAAFLFLALLSMLFVKHGDVKKQ